MSIKTCFSRSFSECTRRQFARLSTNPAFSTEITNEALKSSFSQPLLVFQFHLPTQLEGVAAFNVNFRSLLIEIWRSKFSECYGDTSAAHRNFGQVKNQLKLVRAGRSPSFSLFLESCRVRLSLPLHGFLDVITRCIILILKVETTGARGNDRSGLFALAAPAAARPRIAINFSSSTEFSSREGLPSARPLASLRSAPRTCPSPTGQGLSFPPNSPLLPSLRFFLLEVRTRSLRVASLAPRSSLLVSIISILSRICSRGALVRSRQKLRRSEGESCLKWPSCISLVTLWTSLRLGLARFLSRCHAHTRNGLDDGQSVEPA